MGRYTGIHSGTALEWDGLGVVIASYCVEIDCSQQTGRQYGMVLPLLCIPAS